MFQKINLNFKDADVPRLKGELHQKYGNPETKLSNFLLSDWNYFLSLHNGKIKFAIRPHFAYYTEIEGDHYLYPHIDPATTVALNAYINSANSTTTFYKEKEDIKYKLGNQELDEDDDTLIVKAFNDFSKLEEVGSFTAQSGEAYLMRVDILHSVSKPEGVRSMITYRWHTHSFEEILNSIITS